MSFPYRCTKESCKQRRALRKHANEYVREPRCRSCGSRLRYDRWEKQSHKRKKCYCDGYMFIHRKGSKWCQHYAVVITDFDMDERRGRGVYNAIQGTCNTENAF